MGTKPGNCQKVTLGIVSMGKIVEIPVMQLLSHVASIRRTESPFVIKACYPDISREFRSITNDPLKYTRTSILTLDLNSRSVPVKVYICHTLQYPMVLSYDAMRENALIFDAESCQVFFRKDVSKDFRGSGFSNISSLAKAIGSVNVVAESEVCCKNIVGSVVECDASPSTRLDGDVSVFNLILPLIEIVAGKGLDISSDSSEGFVVRLVRTEMVPAQSIKRVRVRTQLPEGAKFSLSYFSPVDHSKLLEIDDQLVEIDESGFFDLLLVNNADQDIQVKKKFRDIFAAHESHLGACEAVKHTINTRNSPPTKSRPYNVPHALRDVLKEELDTLLEAGIVEEGDGPYAAPRLMDRVFKSLLHKTLECFLDDLISHTENTERHLNVLELGFAKVREANLRLRPSKCKFLAESVVLLGHLVSHGSIRPDPEKIRAIEKLDYPSNLEELRSALRIFCWLRKYIPSFSELASPLTELTKKNVPFEWTELHGSVFNSLKEKLISSPISGLPRIGKDFDFEVAYRPGSQNKVPDTLSRLPVVSAVVDSDSFPILPQAIDMEELRKAQKADRFCTSIVKYLASKLIMPLDVEKLVIREIQNFVIENGVLFHVSTASDATNYTRQHTIATSIVSHDSFLHPSISTKFQREAALRIFIGHPRVASST
ncbi:hypothetical protein QYM36_003957 [Artemia franciscana]|uniref:Reverse transcriptase domain-containing protein n=1 Tax=Artemia franciscana TaxID=6661 RepID=A0AA88LHF3_ARTSF|nr:hypothetical protein QYM36_003957 [Artemia franciscana]